MAAHDVVGPWGAPRLFSSLVRGTPDRRYPVGRFAVVGYVKVDLDLARVSGRAARGAARLRDLLRGSDQQRHH